MRNQQYTRMALAPGAGKSAVRLTSPDLEKRIDPVSQESQRFWCWAAIEILRHSPGSKSSSS